MYTISIVPLDLRHEETIIQTVLALDSLQKVINLVFERIDSRIKANNDKVQNFKSRITKAQIKIKGLEGIKSALKISSPARFPSVHVLQDIPLTFPQTTNPEELIGNKNSQRILYEIKSDMDPSVLQEKLSFFHVRPAEKGDDGAKTIAAAKKRLDQHLGMGVISEDMEFINSLLLHNTRERIYAINNTEDLSSQDGKKFRARQHQRPDTVVEKKTLIQPAPYSLTHKQHSWQRPPNQSALFYTPGLNEAPEIDLPMHLPDLPGIADDIKFIGKKQQKITPSLFIESLPDFPELQTTSSNEEPEVETSLHLPSQKLPPPPPPPPPPLPPPPPPPSSSPAPISEPLVTSPIPTKVSLSSTPKQSNVDSEKSDKSIELSSVDAASNARSDLMDAIRKAGGARGGRLRAAADISKKSELSLPTKQTVTSNNLMADLHNKLLMRRKGISGTRDNEFIQPVGSNPVISQLSALIPPPPQSIGKTKRFNDEEDETDTDWTD